MNNNELYRILGDLERRLQTIERERQVERHEQERKMHTARKIIAAVLPGAPIPDALRGEIVREFQLTVTA